MNVVKQSPFALIVQPIIRRTFECKTNELWKDFTKGGPFEMVLSWHCYPKLLCCENNLINMKGLCELGFIGSFHLSTQMMMVLKGCWHPSRVMFLFLRTLTSWSSLFVWGLDCVSECDGKMLWKGEEYGIINVPY
jgi:hypothetical protein